MRSYIMATEQLNHEVDEIIPLAETITQPGRTLLEDLGDIVFRLRAFMESNGGDYGLGVETGMARAADMIENALKRHSQGD
jgi:hypothetical protein